MHHRGGVTSLCACEVLPIRQGVCPAMLRGSRTHQEPQVRLSLFWSQSSRTEPGAGVRQTQACILVLCPMSCAPLGKLLTFSESSAVRSGRRSQQGCCGRCLQQCLLRSWHRPGSGQAFNKQQHWQRCFSWPLVRSVLSSLSSVIGQPQGIVTDSPKSPQSVRMVC